MVTNLILCWRAGLISMVAKVISSTENLTDNYITLDKGTKDGIKTRNGSYLSTGNSWTSNVMQRKLLSGVFYSHSNFQVSSEILGKKLRKEEVTALGIGKWGRGTNPKMMELTTVDRFKPVSKGDSVVTSMQNSIFPA